MTQNAIIRASATAIFLALITAPLQAGEGFGMMKKTANLTRVHPPEVFITGTRIAIRVTAADSRWSVSAHRLQSQLESELLGKNERLKLDASRPDATIDVSVLQNQYTEKWESRRMIRSVPNGKDSKGRTQYRQEEITVQFKIVGYSFNTSFKVYDVRADKSLAADTSDWTYSKDFQEGNGSPDAASLENSALQAIVNSLITRLAPTREVVGVLLPRGSLETAAAFADAGMWSKYLDALDKLPPLKNPTDESYRQYALGVAYEALGYGAEDHETTLKYLEQASVHYNNAVDANPKEGYFTKPYQSVIFSSRSAEAPIARVSAALVQYQRLKQFNDEVSPTVVAAKGAKGDLASPPNDAVTNQSIIDMMRAGLPDDVVITAIDSAAHTAFDVSPKGLIQLADAKASKRIIQRIQAVSAKGTTPAKPKKTATKKP